MLCTLNLLSKDVGVGRGMPPSFALPTFGLKQLDSELSTSITVFSGSVPVMEALSVTALRTLPVLYCTADYEIC